MANFLYEGLQTRSIDNFDPENDVLTLNLTPAQIADVRETDGSTQIVTTAGFVLTLTGVTYAELAAQQDSIVLQSGGDFAFSSGTTVTGTGIGDVLIGSEASDTLIGNGGNNLIFGGGSVGSPNDVGDSITAGNGNDTIYGNGGNDTISSTGGNDIVYGGLGNDTITLNAQAGQTVTVFGGGGAGDTQDGADTITIGSSVAGGAAAGNALVYGNAGNDTISVFANGSNTVFGGFGNDSITVTGNGNNLILGGLDDQDVITVTGNGNNTIFGGSGVSSQNDLRDVITVTGNGNNAVYGNGGDDELTIVGNGNNSIFGGIGNDELNLGTNASVATGNNLLVGGTGTNEINVFSSGNTTIFGGSGVSDTADLVTTLNLNVTNGTHVAYTNAGEDVVNATVSGSARAEIYLGADDDSLTLGGTGTGARTLVFGGTGEDNINLAGFAGNSTIFGGVGISDPDDGDDTIQGGNGNDLIYGNGGNDILASGAGNDTLSGGAGRDLFIFNDGGGTNAVGAAGNKVVLDYVAAEDVIAINGGTDAGNYLATASGDSVVLTAFNTTVPTGQTAANAVRTITLNGAANQVVTVGFNDGLTTAQVIAAGLTQTSENLLVANLGTTAATIGGAGAAFDGDDRFFSGAAADTINITGGGDDFVSAGAGNDTINAGTQLTAADTIDGGAGIDVINVTDDANLTNVRNVEVLNVNADTTATITLGSADVVANGATFTLNASASTAAVTFDGSAEVGPNAGRFSITGGTGNDVFTGGAGNDTIIGGAGNDQLAGGAGNDSIVGGVGTDQITGGTGLDTMTGGAGVDTFVFAAGDTGTPSPTTFDVITDWNVGGDADIIDFSGGSITIVTNSTAAAGVAAIDAEGLATFDASDNTLAEQIVAVEAGIATGSAAAGQTAFFVNGGNTYVFISDGADGVGANDVLIQLTGFEGSDSTLASGNLSIA